MIPFFVISAHPECDDLVAEGGSGIQRINRLYAAFTALDSTVHHVNMAYSREKFMARLPGLLARRADDSDPDQARNRIDLKYPTLLDVEYLDPRTEQGLDDLIEIMEIFRDRTRHANPAGYYRLIPYRGPYWSQRNVDLFMDHNRSLSELAIAVDFCAVWCHPITRERWEERSIWERLYSMHLKNAIDLAHGLFCKRAYIDLTINYHPSSPDRAGELLPAGRFEWMIGEAIGMGADGIIIDKSTDMALTSDSDHWEVIRDFAGD